MYLTSGNVYNEKKIRRLEEILNTTSANGIVIDFKDSNTPKTDYMTKLVTRFKKQNVYVIARIVVCQDSYFAKKHPETAITTADGAFWWSGRKKWQRYWIDPASPKVLRYTIETAKKAIDTGFDEIQFDYIRFPSDGNMSDLVYPIFNPHTQTKQAVMKWFFKNLHTELKEYSPSIVLSIDVFGEIFLDGKEPGIGQYLTDMKEYFDVISPMAYPSHFRCKEFGVQDPTAYPYRVYFQTLQKGKKIIGEGNTIIRPWIQDFTIPSIYKCGPLVQYNKEKVSAQIKAGYDLEIKGFMLWNAKNVFTSTVFD